MIQALYGLAKSANATDVDSLASSYGSWSGIRTNHVLDMSGNFSGGDGSSRSITTAQDRELLLALRSRAELIVVDAATARLEQYRAPKTNTSLAIFSRSGDFSKIPAVENSGKPIYLFSGNSDPKHAKNPNVVFVPVTASPFEQFLKWAKNHSIDSILLEAGPTLTKRAFEAGIVRQSAVTRTGVSSATDLTKMENPFDSEAKLISLALGSGASFSLWLH